MENKLQKTPKYFTKGKDYLVFIVGVLSFVYLLNFTLGFVEFLPDSIPLLGNIDEAAATYLLYSSFEYFGINIKTLFKRSNK